MACIPAAARKQASRHLVVRPVVQEKSAQEFLFSLSMVHIRTEDYKVLDGGVSRSAMPLASTTFWYHTKRFVQSLRKCLWLRAESGLYDGQGAEDSREEGELSPSRKTGG